MSAARIGRLLDAVGWPLHATGKKELLTATEVRALREVTAFGDRERQYVAADGDPLFSAMSDALAELQNPEAGDAITNVFGAALAVTFTARQHAAEQADAIEPRLVMLERQVQRAESDRLESEEHARRRRKQWEHQKRRADRWRRIAEQWRADPQRNRELGLMRARAERAEADAESLAAALREQHPESSVNPGWCAGCGDRLEDCSAAIALRQHEVAS